MDAFGTHIQLVSLVALSITATEGLIDVAAKASLPKGFRTNPHAAAFRGLGPGSKGREEFIQYNRGWVFAHAYYTEAKF